MEAVLCVQDLYKHYPGFALEDVSFFLAPKRIMGLIGKNGAGKSTTLKCILNMVSPESGSVEIFQKDFIQYEKECLLHQRPPSNSSENLLRPSASVASRTVAL